MLFLSQVQPLAIKSPIAMALQVAILQTIAFWAIGRVFRFLVQIMRNGCAGVFEIANIELLSPDDGAVVGLPTTFEWKSRGIAGDKYRWHIQTYIEDVCSQESAGSNTQL